MEISKKSVGNVIRTVRKRRSHTIEELAYLSGLHSTHIGKIERGEISPSVENLDKIVSVLNLNLVEFFKMISPNSDTLDITNVMIQKRIDSMTLEEKEMLLQFLELYHSH
ncbi:helix-turn-helix transcriptional regulator [Paenibacillus frigoriresistens]|uniref:helix-turn-helix domain-containing protein n=1 Tax=Paenibacillus alginolyticus TaxID=59839 RepID=UPI0015678F0C|nr:helix-turn-helix transcriptional regulator [Paenibacillus frigoriresistens]NRF93221.1 helix-turn-helix transcriptional regulator [Paenibacillus frigoriresistens]